MAEHSNDESRPRRRAPAGERKRDPVRTREKILEAALAEFSEHGYAGARIAAIARRAGVNQQLISYYFDGKAGLLQALNDRWRETSMDLRATDRSTAATVQDFVRVSSEQRPWTRLLIWEGLTGGEQPEDPEYAAYFGAITDDVRRRQQAGELPSDLDAGHLSLILFGAAMAHVALPHVARHLTGEDPNTPEFLDKYADQLARLLTHLTGPADDRRGG